VGEVEQKKKVKSERKMLSVEKGILGRDELA